MVPAGQSAFPYFDLYRKQVVKQADLVLAMHLRGDAFTPEQKARNFAYYEALTVRDSTLSASTQAVLAASPSSPTTTWARQRSWICTTWPTTRGMDSTWHRWLEHGRRWSRGSAVCACSLACFV